MIYILLISIWLPLNLLVYLITTKNFPNLSTVNIVADIIFFWFTIFLIIILINNYYKIKFAIKRQFPTYKKFRNIYVLSALIFFIVTSGSMMFFVLSEFTNWNFYAKLSTIILSWIYLIIFTFIVDNFISFFKAFRAFLKENMIFNFLAFFSLLIFCYLLFNQMSS